MNLVKIKYVGKKKVAYDNVAGSGKRWNGNGDFQEVTESEARVLLRYPDQWGLKDESSSMPDEPPKVISIESGDGLVTEVEASAMKKPFEKMSKAELCAYAADKFGQKLDMRQSSKHLIDQIEDWEAVGL